MNQALSVTDKQKKVVEHRATILVISDASETITAIDTSLSSSEFELLVVSDVKRTVDFFSYKHIDFVIIDSESIAIPGDELVRTLRIHMGDHFIPIIVLAVPDEEERLSDCIVAGCDDFLIKPFTATALKTRISSLEQVCELKKLYKSTVNEQLVAKNILSFALSERNVEFEEIRLLSRAKGVFSGDLFLTAKRPDGSLHVLLADFTGHGLSAAIGALPVADVFSAMTEKGFDLTHILENINDKLHTLLPTSMFMACSMLKINSDLKYVEMWNGGMPDIYIRNGKTGAIKHRLKSKHIPLGINETTASRFDLDTIELTQDEQLILYSDGLTDAVNAEGEMFGEHRLEQCIENDKDNESIFSDIVQAFNHYCGKINPNDDVTLACIPCSSTLTEISNPSLPDKLQIASNQNEGWCWYMELSGSSLHNVNPVPIVVNEVNKISGEAVSEDKLSCVLNVLYENAIEHGIQYALKKDSKDNNVKIIDRENTKKIDNNYLRIGLKKIKHKGESALLVSIEDSGKGFDHVAYMSQLLDRKSEKNYASRGIPLVYKLSDSLNYHGTGNCVEAIINEQV